MSSKLTKTSKNILQVLAILGGLAIIIPLGIWGFSNYTTISWVVFIVLLLGAIYLSNGGPIPFRKK